MTTEPVTSDRFRTAMSHFATGVSVVTTTSDGAPQGITVSFFSSVSLDPPLVMIALDRRRFITPMIRASGRYAVNVLAEDQQALSDCFAHAPATPGREAFCDAPWHAGETGMPVLDGGLAALECSVVEVISIGDHDLFIGRVEALEHGQPDAGPLLYFRRGYVRSGPAAS